MAARASNFATKVAETVKSVDQFGEHYIMKLETENQNLWKFFGAFLSC